MYTNYIVYSIYTTLSMDYNTVHVFWERVGDLKSQPVFNNAQLQTLFYPRSFYKNEKLLSTILTNNTPVNQYYMPTEYKIFLKFVITFFDTRMTPL